MRGSCGKARAVRREQAVSDAAVGDAAVGREARKRFSRLFRVSLAGRDI
jgi:hypothetical protein